MAIVNKHIGVIKEILLYNIVELSHHWLCEAPLITTPIDASLELKGVRGSIEYRAYNLRQEDVITIQEQISKWKENDKCDIDISFDYDHTFPQLDKLRLASVTFYTEEQKIILHKEDDFDIWWNLEGNTLFHKFLNNKG